jgi:hypothetical protein
VQPRAPLNRERVLRAAVDLADEVEGLPAEVTIGGEAAQSSDFGDAV